jgi:hemoglobin-like flavoprotein
VRKTGFFQENTMTNEQKELVQSSFRQVQPIAEIAAQLFYGKLFEIDPQLRPLFTTDLQEQGRKLMHMMGVAVKGLDQLNELLPALHYLGSKHIAYGVQAKHYDTVGEALIWTLEQGLGTAFTVEVKESWIAVYQLLAEAMQQEAAVAV